LNNGPDEISGLRAEVARLSERVARLEKQFEVVTPGTADTRVSPERNRFGLTAINRIGAVTLAIGLIFFFKYAVDEHLIGAAAGVVLGLLFGCALIGAGDWLTRRGQSVFAQGIAGCGLAALYISVYASFGFYELIGRSAGFAALAAVCAMAVGLSVRFASPAIATLGIAGALLTPCLLHTTASVKWLECGYLFAVAGTAAAIAASRRWAVLVVVAGALSLVTALVLFDRPSWFVIAAAGLGVSQAIGFVRSPAGSLVRNSFYVIAHAAFLCAGLRGLAVADRNVAYQGASILLGCWGIGALTWGLSRASKVDLRLGLTLLGLVIAKLYVWDIWSLDNRYRITAFLGLGALLLAASWIYSRTSFADRL
jgi:uncharacterized membrane protein